MANVELSVIEGAVTDLEVNILGMQLSVMDGTAVALGLSIPGVQGAIGPVGPSGVQGPVGPSGATGPAGQGVPSGGAIDQVLLKLSSANYDTAWGTINTRELTIPPFDNVNLVYSGERLVAAAYPIGGFYDYVSLTYSGSLLLQTDYKTGGDVGSTVATYVLTYSGDTVTGINRTL